MIISPFFQKKKKLLIFGIVLLRKESTQTVTRKNINIPEECEQVQPETFLMEDLPVVGIWAKPDVI